ncbi:MAG TPA: hypothetical protein VHR66_24565 [Gemmataceae bacterium]|jgi:hypothetical protein|nr:hypothetical protein [Gemmataceae bacterium]
MKRWLALVFVTGALAGCTDQPMGIDGAGTIKTPEKPTAPATFDRKPEVLLSSRKADKLIVAIDFAGSRAMDKSLPVAERRQYVLEQSVALYAAYAKKETAGQKVRLMALSVPSRDDYARGDFRNMDELAICDTDHAAAVDAGKKPDERAGQVEWRAGLGS